MNTQVIPFFTKIRSALHWISSKLAYGWPEVPCIGLIFVSLAGYFGGVHFIADGLVHFRAHYLALAIFLVPLLLIQKRNAWCLLIVATMILNAMELAPWYFSPNNIEPTRTNQTATKDRLRICSINVYKRNRNSQRCIDFIRDLRPDILVLQEVNTQFIDDIKTLSDLFPYRAVSGRKGRVLLSRFPILHSESVWFSPKGRRSIRAWIAWNNKKLFILDTHIQVPRTRNKWNDRNVHLKNLAATLKTNEHPILLMGDFNVTLFSSHYKRFEETSGLINARKGFGLLPTWPSPVAVLGIPIDHIFHSSHFQTESIQRGPHLGSDHVPLWADIRWNQPNPEVQTADKEL